MKRFCKALGLATVLALFGTQAQAYIPPSGFIVKKMATRHSDLKSLRLRSNVVGMNGEQPTGAHFKTVTTFDLSTRTLKSRAYDDAGRVLYAMERRIAPIPGKENETYEDSALLAEALLLDPNPVTLTQLLRSAKIPVKTDEELLQLENEAARRAVENTWLSRWNSNIAWVIGPKRKTAPQLWIEKDSFLPIRMIAYDEDGELVDARFENFRHVRDFPYPRRITVAYGGVDDRNIIFQEELREIAVNPGEEDKKPVRIGYTSAGETVESAVKDLIRKYYQTIR